MAYNKITLYGKQTCDYLYIQNTATEDNEFVNVDDAPAQWKDETVLYANFNNKNNRLGAGDSEIAGRIDGYEIYRKKYNEAHAEYIGTIKKSGESAGDLMIDYTVRNGVDYSYYLYPGAEKSQSGTVLYPFVTKQLSMDCPYWSLFIVDETEEENIFYLDKMFKFELNLQVDNMTNNAQVTISQNFTKYPTVQYGASNYWTGSLSSLCGFIASNCIDYVQTTNMINEVKSISSDTRRKFLKDIEGNLWEVNVASPISITTEQVALKELKTWSFSWVEVGDANGISIISNPNKPVTDWVLTENGVMLPHFTYVWGDNYKWDNSYFWTSNDDIYRTKSTNLGREISK